MNDTTKYTAITASIRADILAGLNAIDDTTHLVGDMSATDLIDDYTRRIRAIAFIDAADTITNHTGNPDDFNARLLRRTATNILDGK